MVEFVETRVIVDGFLMMYSFCLVHVKIISTGLSNWAIVNKLVSNQ